MKYEKKCLRCGAVTAADKWPGAAMHKTVCRVICKDTTTHHYSEQKRQRTAAVQDANAKV